MKSINLPIMFVDENAILPEKIGLNKFALKSAEDLTLEAGERKIVKTQISCALPSGYEMRILSDKYYIVNEPGTIDYDYRGQIGIIILNNTNAPLHISKHERIAVGEVVRYEKVSLIENNAKRENEIEIVKTKEYLLPFYATEGAAGMDITSSEDTVVKAGEQKAVKVDMYIVLDNDFNHNIKCEIRSRSGLAAKAGIHAVNKVLKSPFPLNESGKTTYSLSPTLHNTSNQDFVIKSGDRIAQVVFTVSKEIADVKLELVKELPSTDRGAGGFGSTGVKTEKSK